MTGTATRIPVAFARMHNHDQPDDISTYVAVRLADLPALLAAADDAMLVEQCELAVPEDAAAMLAAQLATPMRRATVIVGTVEAGTWVTGPMAGQAAP